MVTLLDFLLKVHHLELGTSWYGDDEDTAVRKISAENCF